MKKKILNILGLFILGLNLLSAQTVITQEGGNCTTTVSYNGQPVSLVVGVTSEAQSLYFTVQTDCLFLKATSTNNPNWITLPSSIGNDFTIGVQENQTPNLRFDVIRIVDRDDNIIVNFKIEQSGNPAYIAYYPDSDNDGFGDFNATPTYATSQPSGLVNNNLDYCPNEASSTNNGCIDASGDVFLNYTRSYTYDRNGKLISASKGYFDDLGKATQAQSYDVKKKRIWATESRYDSQGRPVLSTLGAPITNEVTEVSFGYKSNFIKKTDGSDFTPSDYENDDVDPAIVGAQDLTLGNYYSSSNMDEKLRDITDRPYSKNIYSELAPGTVKQVVGGNKINGEWKRGYSFSMPAAQEPYYVLGFNYFESNPEIAGTYENISSIINDDTKQIAWLKATKSVVQNVHQVEAVVFTDADGKTIGAARSGGTKQYEVLSLIGEQKFVDIHIPIGCENTASLLTSASDYKVYDLKTEEVVSATALQNAGFYRIEYVGAKVFTKSSNLSYIDKQAGTIHPVESNAVGIRYKLNYYDFSLNEYDDIGRLTKSLQPLGFNDACLNNLSATVTHDESLKLNFIYNSINQLVFAKSPDEGTIEFKYRKDGQIRFSQNSKQLAIGEFSYTNYDELGRPFESGVCTGNFTTLNPDGGNDFAGTRKEQHFTKYDYLEILDITYLTGIHSSYANPSFLSGNVAKTYNLDASGNEISATYYSYDVYGRVQWIIQKIQGAVDAKSVTINYEYDATTSQVTKVLFQKNVPGELFVHRYTYDDDTNELIKVETSTDNTTFITHAEYDYYENGALKRTTLAEGIQDIDYVYNFNGQLKAINHPSLATDPEINPNGTDLFGMSLDYYTDDYRRDTKFIEFSAGQDQYNGNIKSMTWNTDVLQNGQSSPLQYSYQYDKNNWLTAATFASTNNNLPSSLVLNQVVTISQHNKVENSIVLQPGFSATATTSLTFKAEVTGSSTEFGANDYNVSNITYDANGNIESLNRNKNTENGTNRMDELTYAYKNGKSNRLDHVKDDVGNAGFNDIDSQSPGNYIYNEIGQLTRNEKEDVDYQYNVSGLVTKVSYNGKTKVEFVYNDKNFRTKKISYQEDGQTPQQITDYIRDAAGSVLAIYENGDLKELPIYGAGRLGIYNKQANTSVYQLTDHLGNIRAVIAKQGSNAIALTSTTDYYPFGMPMPGKQTQNGEVYRYGYQGQEVDPETGKPAFQLRLWDARIGRWLSPDPYRQFVSPYLGMGNNPMNGVDPDGGCWITNDDGSTSPCPDGNIGDSMVGNMGATWTFTDHGWDTDAFKNQTVYINSPNRQRMIDELTDRYNFINQAEADGLTIRIHENRWVALGHNLSMASPSARSSSVFKLFTKTPNYTIDPAKFKYFFGQVKTGRLHSITRSAQNARDLKTLGITTVKKLKKFLDKADIKGVVQKTMTNDHGTSVIKRIVVNKKGAIDVNFFTQAGESVPRITTIIPKIYKQ
ncbi:RHS repeat-associated core domain-containing protein [Tenacibaculum sp. MEBiC06402]|uniref:RHS repeat-associated core domain-containing protein n=1 Tax=unclassified Tenacibaculum TaxID=2635139 RepID=UPI003B9A8DFA